MYFKPLEHEELVYQLTNFPDVPHDDVMDAFVYALNNITVKNRSIDIRGDFYNLLRSLEEYFSI